MNAVTYVPRSVTLAAARSACLAVIRNSVDFGSGLLKYNDARFLFRDTKFKRSTFPNSEQLERGHPARDDVMWCSVGRGRCGENPGKVAPVHRRDFTEARLTTVDYTCNGRDITVRI